MNHKNPAGYSATTRGLWNREVSCLEKAEILIKACQHVKTLPEDRTEFLELLDVHISAIENLIIGWEEDGVPVPDDLPKRFENVKKRKIELEKKHALRS